MKFGQRLRSRLWRARVEDEVDSELSFHVEMRARELVEQRSLEDVFLDVMGDDERPG